MYGMVNRAIEDMVRRQHGDAAWEDVRRASGLEPTMFVSMAPYPDEVTYALAGAACRVLGLPLDRLLTSLGEHWVHYTGEQGYGGLLRMGGRTFREFLLNLENLHSQVAISMPALRPPTFWCTDVTATSARLHYRSVREGLAPMVVGLLQGLGDRFATPVTIEHDRRRTDGADHDEFALTFEPRS